jgi:hypothetical protein
MNKKSYTAMVFGIVIPSVIFFIIVLIVWFIRRNRSHYNNGYNKVSHELDEEEIEFKRMIESHGEDLDDLFSDNLEDLSFDSKEKDRLNMLENFRNNLVSGVGTSFAESQSQAELEERDQTLRI